MTVLAASDQAEAGGLLSSVSRWDDEALTQTRWCPMDRSLLRPSAFRLTRIR